MEDRYLFKTKQKDTNEWAIGNLIHTFTGMPIAMQNVDISDDVKKEFERLKKCGVMVRAENQPSKVECVSNTIFQFPQDDEIEV